MAKRPNLPLLKDVTDPANGMNQLIGEVTINFLAQIVDVYIDDIGEGVKVIIPDMLSDHGPCQGRLRIAHEELQQSIFLGRQINFFVAAPDLVCHRIKTQISNNKELLALKQSYRRSEMPPFRRKMRG